MNRNSSRCLVAKVEDEGADEAGGVSCGQSVGQLEVGAVGADGHGTVGIIERVAAAEVELCLVALAADADGGISAGEGEHVRDGGVMRGVADGDALEHGADEVAARGGVLAVVGHVVGGLVPLDDEGRAGRDGLAFSVGEVQRQRAAGQVAHRGVQRHGLHAVAAERAALRADAEGQAQRVPRAVLVEGAALELDGEARRSVVGGYDVGVLASLGLSTVIIEQNQRIPPVGRYSDGLHVGLVPDVGRGEIVAGLLLCVRLATGHPVVEHLAEGGGEAAGGQGVVPCIAAVVSHDIAGHRARAAVGIEHDSVVQHYEGERESLLAAPVACAFDSGLILLSNNIVVDANVGVKFNGIVRVERQPRLAVPHLHVVAEWIVGSVAVVVGFQRALDVAGGDVPAPLCIEHDVAVYLVGQVVYLFLVIVVCAAAVGFGVPFFETIARAGERVGGQRSPFAVIGQQHWLHRAFAAIGIEADGVGTGCDGYANRLRIYRIPVVAPLHLIIYGIGSAFCCRGNDGGIVRAVEAVGHCAEVGCAC